MSTVCLEPGEEMTRTRLERLCDGWIEAGWLIALTVTPLVFNAHSTRVFEPEKATLVRAVALVMTAAWVLRWAAAGRAWRSFEGSDGRHRRLSRTAGLAVSLFLAVNFLATLLSIAPRVSWWGSYDRMQGTATTLAYIALCALVAGTLRSVEQWRRLVYAVTLTSIPVALYAVVQSLGHDPVTWGTDHGQRVGSTLGNPIFLGGYLAPVALVTAGELAAVWWMPGARRRVATGVVFGFALVLQLTALLLSQSRGPFAGLLAGVFTIALLGALISRSSTRARRARTWLRHAWLIPIAGASLTVAVFVAAARPDSPLAWLRQVPQIGRILTALDPESHTTRYRGLVWRGMDRLWRSPQPIEYPDGGGDRLSGLRPLIGHGPETLRVLMPAISPPDLARIERLHVFPDRAHNEVFDVLATTGLLGLGAFFLLWGCVFASAASGLGWVGEGTGRGSARLWWTLAGSMAAGVAGVAATGHAMFLGLAVPAGLLIGFFGHSIVAAVRGSALSTRARDRADTIRVVVLSGALVAHLVEIQTGIAVTVTRCYFWIFWAALVVVAAAGLERRPASVRKAAAFAPRGDAAGARRRPWSEMLLASAALLTLVFDFMTRSEGAGRPAIVVLLAGTWLFALAAMWAGGRRPSTVVFAAAGSLALALGFGGLSSAVLAGLARRQQTLAPSEIGGWITAPYTTWLAAILLLLLAIGRGLARPGSGAVGKPNSEDRQYWLLAPVLGLVVIVAVSILIERVSLRPIHADMLFKHGQAYFDQERFDECLDLYRLALEVDPHSDRLWLARGHLEKIRAMRASSPGERRRWFEQAAISIDRAVALHPLFIEHLVYRARLFSAWSDLSPNPQAAGERSERALRDLEQAAARSPGSTGLRNLVAELHLHRGERQQAEALLQRSLTADPRTVGTYLSLARMRLEEAAAVEGAAAEASLRAALELYDRAIVVAPRVPELHAGRGYVMLQLGRPAAAISAYSQALALRPGDTTSHLALANLHHRLGHSLRALKHARVAHESNDQSEKSRAAELIRELVGE